GLELGLVGGNELAKLVRHVEQLEPLLLVERDGESPQAVDGYAPLLAHLDGDAPGRALLQRLVFTPKALQLRLEILVCHHSLRVEPADEASALRPASTSRHHGRRASVFV